MVRHSCEGIEAGTCVHTDKVKKITIGIHAAELGGALLFIKLICFKLPWSFWTRWSIVKLNFKHAYLES